MRKITIGKKVKVPIHGVAYSSQEAIYFEEIEVNGNDFDFDAKKREIDDRIDKLLQDAVEERKGGEL